MADVKWIKITTNMFEDEKIDYIQTLPEADAIILIWIRLLTMAGKCCDKGYIYLTEKIPYNDNMLANRLNKPVNIVKLALQVLQNLEMIQFMENGYIHITNWDKHQNMDTLEKKKEYDKLYQREKRAKEKEKKMLPSPLQDTNPQIDGKIVRQSDDESYDSREKIVKNRCLEEEEDKELDIDNRYIEEEDNCKNHAKSSSSSEIQEIINLLRSSHFEGIESAPVLLKEWINDIGYENVKYAILDAISRKRIKSLDYVKKIIHRMRIDLIKAEKQPKASDKYEHFYL